MRRETTVLLSVVLALVLIGILIVYSASSAGTRAAENLARPDPYHYLWRQLVNAALGLVVMVVALKFDYHRLRDPGLFRSTVFLSLTLLVLVLIPGIGVVRGGARRWMDIGGFSFQPSEFAKVALVLLLAAKLSDNQNHIREFWKGFLPPMLMAGLFAILIYFEGDLGMPVVLGAAALLMVMMAGARWWHIGLSLLPAVGAVVVLAVTTPYRLERLRAFADPWKYRDDESWQLIQSLAAFAHGALWGRGPGASEQKLYYLSDAHTDFIFAIWGEEMGLVGTLLVVALFATIMIVGMRIALCAPDLFGSLLASGITALLVFQGAINMAVTTGLLPTKGLPLPFVSAGGSALIVSLGLVGIMMNIGLQGQEPKREPKRALAPAT